MILRITIAVIWMQVLLQCEAHTYYNHYQRFRRPPPRYMYGPPVPVYPPPVYRGGRPIYRPPIYRRPLYRRPVFRPVKPPPSFISNVFNLLGGLPISFYNNYVCNVLSATGFDPRLNGSPNVQFYIRTLPRSWAHNSMFHVYSIIRGVYYGLNPFWEDKNRSKLLSDVTRVTFYMFKYPFRIYSASDVLKQVIRERLLSTKEKGNMEHIYNLMKQIRNTDVSTMRGCATRMVQQSCGSIQGQFYCNYVAKLTKVPTCSSAFFASQLLNRCCQQPVLPQVETQPPKPKPALTPTTHIPTTTTTKSLPSTTTKSLSSTTTKPLSSTTTKPLSSTTAKSPATTMTVTTSTTAPPVKTCGISSKNPAAKFADFSNTLRQFRIVGGVQTELCEYPWMVRLQVGNSLCGGTIIDETHILTAGHCVASLKPADVEVNAGEYNYALIESQDQVARVSAINIHPDFKLVPPSAAVNDIAILTLAAPLTYNDCVRPLCLPEPGDSSALDTAQCTITGWGTTSYGGQTSPILQEVTVPTYNGQLCDATYANTNPINASTQICAGRPAIGGADACQGDSGGPLFCPVGGRYVQYGIVSYGDGCGLLGNAGVYTDVSAMLSFINSVIK